MSKSANASPRQRAYDLLLKFAYQHKNRTVKEVHCKDCRYDDSETNGMTLYFCKKHWEWRTQGHYLRDAALYRARQAKRRMHEND